MSLTLFSIGQLLASQDNLATADPIFVVMQKAQIIGVDPDYGTDYHVWTVDGEEVEDEVATLLDGLEKSGGEIPRKYDKVYCRDREEWVMPFFTREAAEHYLTTNTHNLRKPFIFVHSAYRNPEWQFVRSLCLAHARGESAS